MISGEKALNSNEINRKVLTDDFLDEHGNLIAQEQAVRQDTVDILINELKAKKENFENKLEKIKGAIERANAHPASVKAMVKKGEEIQTGLEEKLTLTKQKLKLYEEQKKATNAEWASTNTPRLVVRSLGENARKLKLLPYFSTCALKV